MRYTPKSQDNNCIGIMIAFAILPLVSGCQSESSNDQHAKKGTEKITECIVCDREEKFHREPRAYVKVKIVGFYHEPHCRAHNYAIVKHIESGKTFSVTNLSDYSMGEEFVVIIPKSEAQQLSIDKSKPETNDEYTSRAKESIKSSKNDTHISWSLRKKVSDNFGYDPNHSIIDAFIYNATIDRIQSIESDSTPPSKDEDLPDITNNDNDDTNDKFKDFRRDKWEDFRRDKSNIDMLMSLDIESVDKVINSTADTDALQESMRRGERNFQEMDVRPEEEEDRIGLQSFSSLSRTNFMTRGLITNQVNVDDYFSNNEQFIASLDGGQQVLSNYIDGQYDGVDNFGELLVAMSHDLNN